MPSSSRRRVSILTLAALAWSAVAPTAAAQQAAQGFRVDRLYTSAPGGGWFVMDALDMRGGVGGAMGLTTGYASKPLRITDGQKLAVVTRDASVDLGFAATYDRWRLYLNLTSPVLIEGHSGTVGGYAFAAPAVNPGSNPDLLSDARVGLDVRLVGDARGPFRVGAGAQLFVPNGRRADYDTDGSYRVMGRALVAGDVGGFTYAGHVGVHVRPLGDAPTPGSPQGSELLLGIAGGGRLPAFGPSSALIVGPEFFGASAFRSLFGANATALEGLLAARLEGTSDDGPQLRVKLGAGAGLLQHFGAPEWRAVFAIEVFDHATSNKP